MDRRSFIAALLFVTVILLLGACAPAVSTATQTTSAVSQETPSSPSPSVTSSTPTPANSPTTPDPTSTTPNSTITPSSTPAARSYPIVDTAQTLWYDDAGEIAAPGTGNRFYGQDADFTGNYPIYRDNGDGTVTDLVTGLMWQQSPDQNGDGIIDTADKRSQAGALAGAASLDLAGYTDWRLPAIKDLYSLIIFTGVEPLPNAASTAGAAPFIDTDYFDFAWGNVTAGDRYIDAQYATSTLYVGTTNLMFGVNFADGRIKGYPIAGKDFFVLYVRGNPAYGQNDFVDNTDGTVTDAATGLMWSQADSGTGMDWESALAWVQQKNAENFLGHDDWRLPDAKEMQSIVDYGRAPDATSSAAIDPVFTCTPITNERGETDYPYYWTGTTHLSANIPPGVPSEGVYLAFGRALGYLAQSPLGNGWVDIHGAGAQRSDPKSGDPSAYASGRGPQGDSVHILNFVRLVRDAD